MNKVKSDIYNWKLLEELFIDQSYKAVKQLLRSNTDQMLYAVVFYASYREQDGKLHFPMIAANCVKNIEINSCTEDEQGYFSIKWNPYDWKWQEIEFLSDELIRLENQLQTEANSKTTAYWNKVEKLFLKSMVRTSKKLYTKLKKDKHVTKDFVVFFHDEDGGAKLAKNCMSLKLFLNHFPEFDEIEQERKRVATYPVKEQVEYYISRLNEHEGIGCEEAESKLIQLGNFSCNGLVEKISEPQIGWKVASILGRIGIVEPQIIATLRAEVKRGTRASMWSAMSLGLLGDTDKLHELLKFEDTKENAVHGITACYRSWANYCKELNSLNYQPLRALLENGCDDCNKMAIENLAPGVSYNDITIEDLDEALSGLTSSHKLIRQHAVSILGDRSLGNKASLQVLPALAEVLTDECPVIRRLGILSISSWKRLAVKYLPNIEALLADESDKVKVTAKNVLIKLN
ncbi:MAG: DUF4303 domain-containing protein [Alteromonadales bacterium]|nr:DUF4303 domain-containing protein [Alteromonadales bacterium]